MGARSGPLLPHPQGGAARPGAPAVRRLDLRHPPRPVAEPSRHAEGAVVGAVPGLQDPPARRLGREAGVVVHRRQRDTLQPAARRGVPLDRLHSVHPADDPGRGGARRSLGGLGQARVRHSREHEPRKERHESAHLRARAPRVRDRSGRRLHALVHGALRLGEDHDRAPRRPRDGPARPRRRVPRRRHRPHASLEGPRLLEGGPRRARRAARLGRLADHAPRRRRHRRGDLAVRRRHAETHARWSRSTARSSRSTSGPRSTSAPAAT